MTLIPENVPTSCAGKAAVNKHLWNYGYFYMDVQNRTPILCGGIGVDGMGMHHPYAMHCCPHYVGTEVPTHQNETETPSF